MKREEKVAADERTEIPEEGPQANEARCLNNVKPSWLPQQRTDQTQEHGSVGEMSLGWVCCVTKPLIRLGVHRLNETSGSVPAGLTPSHKGM